MSDDKNRGFTNQPMSSWRAPFVGAIVVGLLGVWAAYDIERPLTFAWVVVWAGVGSLIGLLVALVDGPGPGTVVSRFLALISPVTAWLPFIGVPLAAAAYLTNRRHPGGYRSLSRAALAASIVFALGWAVIMVWSLG